MEVAIIAFAVMPEEVAYVGLSRQAVLLLLGEIMLELCRHYSQIVDRICIVPEAFEIQGVDLIVVEDVVAQVGIVVNGAPIEGFRWLSIPVIATSAASAVSMITAARSKESEIINVRPTLSHSLTEQ
jgi:hypothetical protein